MVFESSSISTEEHLGEETACCVTDSVPENMAPPIPLDPTGPESLEPNSIVKTKKAQHSVIAAPFANPSIQVTADHKLKQVEAPIHAPKVGECLVHIKATGICG